MIDYANWVITAVPAPQIRAVVPTRRAPNQAEWRRVQTRLNELGYRSVDNRPVPVSGRLDHHTSSALTRFRVRNSISPTSQPLIVDDVTWNRLMNARTPVREVVRSTTPVVSTTRPAQTTPGKTNPTTNLRDSNTGQLITGDKYQPGIWVTVGGVRFEIPIALAGAAPVLVPLAPPPAPAPPHLVLVPRPPVPLAPVAGTAATVGASKKTWALGGLVALVIAVVVVEVNRDVPLRKSEMLGQGLGWTPAQSAAFAPVLGAHLAYAKGLNTNNSRQDDDDDREKLTTLYRAMCSEEHSSTMRFQRFSFGPSSAIVKYFGRLLNETIAFANHYRETHVIRVRVVTDVLNTIIDGTPVDEHLFKRGGTVIISRGHIGMFNSSIRHLSTAWVKNRG